MIHAQAGNRNKEIPFSDEEFQILANLAKDQFGLNLAKSKKPLVYSRLSKRLKNLGIQGFPEYMALLHSDNCDLEKFELISALTTNVTSFFRERHHFEILSNVLKNEIIPKAKSGKRVRLWSAGCSAGPEPYSIAMTLFKEFPSAREYDVRILATDIDPKILRKAREGIYSMDEMEGIPEALQRSWTKPTDGNKSFKISEELREIITFNELNLISQWPFKGPFDAIFCRNVAIYFDQPTQQNLWNRFSQKLTPGGVLFIGHSERVTGPATDQLEGIGITSYQKVAKQANEIKEQE